MSQQEAQEIYEILKLHDPFVRLSKQDTELMMRANAVLVKNASMVSEQFEDAPF